MAGALENGSCELIIDPVAGYSFFVRGLIRRGAGDIRIVDENMPGADRFGEYHLNWFGFMPIGHDRRNSRIARWRGSRRERSVWESV